jgi:glyoxylase-like metal-dependent hydrolase (beta-lactamase superfamily II)
MFVIRSVEGNRQRLDGGAMYGNVPRALWAQWSPPDERNRIELACRAFLVEDRARGRRILLEAGIGVFFHPKFADRFGVAEPQHVLLQSLAALGVQPADIDVVVLSHLHFDHAGGLLSAWRAGEKPRLLFPRSSFVVSRRAWQRATAPHLRDRASFLPELHELLEASGRLELCDGESAVLPREIYSFSFSDGHTPGLTLSRVSTPRGPITFVGDLVPGTPWVHLPITMGYDRFPELLIDEKRALLDRAIGEQGYLFFTHDPSTAACRVERGPDGRYRPAQLEAEVRWQDA